MTMYYGNSTIGFEADEPAPTAILICPSCRGEILYYGEIIDGVMEITLGECEQAVCKCGAFYGEDDVLEVQPEPNDSSASNVYAEYADLYDIPAYVSNDAEDRYNRGGW
jgi:hypothetical protein